MEHGPLPGPGRYLTYYGADDRPLALALLDVLAHDGPLGFDDLFERATLRLAAAPADKEPVRAMLVRLQRDHYLSRGDDLAYGFVYSLVQRWWALNRD